MAENKPNEAAWTLVDSLRETNQAIAKSVVAAQERNLKFVQSILTNGVEVLKHQAESTRSLMQELEQQTHKQQEALQKLAEVAPAGYRDFFRTQLDFYQKALEAAESATWQGLDNFQKAAQLSIENFERVTQQGLEGMQKATQRAQEIAQRATKSPTQ